MSSSRHWNVRRHIERNHNGFGNPVSDQYTNQYLRGMNSQIPHFPLSYHLSSSPPISSMFFPQQKQKNSPDKAYDCFDRTLESLRKVVEFKNLLSQLAPIPHQQQHHIASNIYYSTPSAATFNSGLSKNIINYQIPIWQIPQDYDSIQIQFPPPPLDPNDIRGYRGIACNYCQTIEVEEILFSKYVGKGGILAGMKHACDPKRTVKIHNNNNDPTDKALQLKKLESKLTLLLKSLVVNNWTKNQNYLFAIEAPNPPKNCIDLTIPADDDNHWAARAIKNTHILLSDDEFTDFLQKVRNATFTVFKIKSQESVLYYLMGITNIPTNKLPNSSFDLSNQQDNKLFQNPCGGFQV